MRSDHVRWIPAIVVIVLASWMSFELLASDHHAWPLLLSGLLASLAAILITRELVAARHELVALPQAALRGRFHGLPIRK